MAYSEEEYLPISGLQHFAFCRRQWALIHIEQQWSENYRTADGRVLHRNVHEKEPTEARGDILITRGMSIHSSILGVSGECDALEFHRMDSGISLSGRQGFWKPFPVEYKRGKSKAEDWDRLQLCCQAMCLEEMLCCKIPEGALYYGETRRREQVVFSEELRLQVKSLLEEMHRIYTRGETPKGKRTKACNACSLKEICLPQLEKGITVEAYIQMHVKE